jgi:hypothetical protein
MTGGSHLSAKGGGGGFRHVTFDSREVGPGAGGAYTKWEREGWVGWSGLGQIWRKEINSNLK